MCFAQGLTILVLYNVYGNAQMQLTRLAQYANLLDWTLGFGCVGYGLYTANVWWVAGGVLGLALAVVNPSKRVARLAQTKVAKKTSFEEG